MKAGANRHGPRTHAVSVCRLYSATEVLEAALAQARETEAATYKTFYTASIFLVIFIEAAGIISVLKSTKDVGWPQAVLVIIFGIRSFDMFSDWVRPPRTRPHDLVRLSKAHKFSTWAPWPARNCTDHHRCRARVIAQILTVRLAGHSVLIRLACLA